MCTEFVHLSQFRVSRSFKVFDFHPIHAILTPEGVCYITCISALHGFILFVMIFRPPCMSSCIPQVYKKADKNGDGSITFNEFLDAYADVNTRDTMHTDAPANSRKSDTHHLDGIMTEEDVRRGCRYFWSNDKDCDGKLNAVEFAGMLSSLGMELEQRDVSRAFRMADIDSDGYIGFGEFVRAYLNKIQPRALTNDKIETIYEHNDIGMKGYLTAKEFRLAMASLGCDMDEGAANKLLSVATGKSKKGRINIGDFCRFLDIESDALGVRMARKALRERRLSVKD